MVMAFAGTISADVIGMTDGEVQAVATPVLDGILNGIKSGNYAEYSKDFDVTLKEGVPEAKFGDVKAQIEGTFGSCESKQYLGFLNKGNMTVILWKARFEKAGPDVLLKLAMYKSGDKYLVAGLWFQ